MENLEVTGAVEADAITEEKVVMRKTTKGAKTKAKVARAGAVKGKTRAKGEASKTVRSGSKTELIAKMLKRPDGCTAAEVLKATGWPSVSMPQQAKVAGLKLTKEGRPARYRAS